MRKYRTYLMYIVFFCSLYILHSTQILYKYRNVDAGKNVRLVFTVDEIMYLNRSNYAIEFDNFRIVLPIDTHVQLGDKIELVGSVESRVIGVIFSKYTLKYPSILNIEPLTKNENFFDNFIYRTRLQIDSFRALLLQNIARVLPHPQAGLLGGMLLGSKVGLSNEFYESLVSSGTLHVVAASGFNISIVAATVMVLVAKSQNKGIRVGLSLVVIWFYAILAGLEPSIVRAALMATIGNIALMYGREYLVNLGLFLSAGVMLVFNPFLIESVGFWLSVSATWGVLTLSSGFVKVFDRVEGVNQKIYISKFVTYMFGFVKTDLATTLAAQVATMPIILIVFSRVSLVAPIANVLILWLIPILMFLGSLVVLFSFLFPPLSYLFGLLAWLPLTYFVKVVTLLGSFSFASVKIGEPLTDGLNKVSAFYILGCYLIMFVSVKLAKLRQNKMQR